MWEPVTCVELDNRHPLLWSIDGCQNRVSADQSHERIVGSGANLLRSYVLLKFSAELLLGFN